MKTKLIILLIVAIVFSGLGLWSIKHNTTNTVSTAGWKTYTDTTNSFSFQYPENSPNNYVSFANIPSANVPITWPPTVTVTTGTFSCNPSTKLVEGFKFGPEVRQITTNPVFCVTSNNQGALGTYYVWYSYTTSYNDKLITFNFTTQQSDCGNGQYTDKSKITACEQGQKAFDPDGLMSQIFSTFKFTK
jgi:hypothetical protein